MPRKRALSAGPNDTPSKASLSISNEPVPKSAQRILNAISIRQEYHKKRKLEADQPSELQSKKRKGNSPKNVSLKIQPGESMQHFIRSVVHGCQLVTHSHFCDRRVEDDMRPLVRSAVQAGRTLERSVARDETAQHQAAKKARQTQAKDKKTSSKHSREASPPPSETHKPSSSFKDFEQRSSSAPRRLNDIAQAPPELKKLPRGASAGHSTKKKTTGVLSMAQQAMMQAEREKAIARYRQLKASQRSAGA